MDIDALVEFAVWLALIVGVMIIGLIAARFARQRLLKNVRSSTKMRDARKKQIQTIAQVVSWIVNMALIAKHDAVFVRRVLEHFANWGRTPMDRELARQALTRLTLISTEGEVLPPDEMKAAAGLSGDRP